MESQEARNMSNKDFCKAFNGQVVGRGFELSIQAGLTGRGNEGRGSIVALQNKFATE
jgi:hypothetical protein